ncbi:hypothetical protein [Paenibacillus paeoniae]|nr:hypothetical protein [Paenibacillus paeoniae]
MPFNKSEKIRNQQNEASIKEEAITPKPDKHAKRPPSLNGIDKQP